MNLEKLFLFKSIFESEKSKLIYSQQVLNNDFCSDGNGLADEGDRASTDLEQSMRMRLRSREALYLKKIEEALKRIHEGTFGLCECCENEIELRRIEARPTCTLCLNCKESEEQKERGFLSQKVRGSLGTALKLRIA